MKLASALLIGAAVLCAAPAAALDDEELEHTAYLLRHNPTRWVLSIPMPSGASARIPVPSLGICIYASGGARVSLGATEATCTDTATGREVVLTPLPGHIACYGFKACSGIFGTEPQ